MVFPDFLGKDDRQVSCRLLFLLRGRKCAMFVNRSITTHNWLHPSESGSSVMASIPMDCHGAYGSSRGEESPYVWC